MRRKKILILPKLRDRDGDLTKKWYVELSQRNPSDGQMVRKRFEVFENCNINDFPDAQSRYEFAEKLIENVNYRIKNGWTIFNDISDAIYEDQLQYSATAKFYKKKITSNNNYAYWISLYMTELFSKKKVAKDTVETYKSRYRVFGNWLHSKGLSEYDLYAITNNVVKDFFDYLNNEQKLCSHTYGSYRQLIYNFFQYVLKKGGIQDNPLYDVPENDRFVDNGAERISKDDIDKLMKEIDEYRPQVGLACRFEYYCGMRPGYEIRLLKIKDIDLRKGISKVTIIAENAKRGRMRKITIPNVFCNYLLNVWRLDTYDKDFYVFGRDGKPGNLPLGKNTLRDTFNRVRIKLGLPDYYKFYSMKHTGAVTLAELGEPMINIRDHLGHTKISTTEIYLKRLGYNDSKTIRNDFPEI